MEFLENEFESVIDHSGDPRAKVRFRAGFYANGSWDRLIHFAAKSALDKRFCDGCTRMTVTLLDDFQVRVWDNGKGISLERDEESGLSLLECVATQVPPDSILSPLFVLNALTAPLTIEAVRDGFLWRVEFTGGLPNGGLEQVRPAAGDEAGTTLTFRLDISQFHSSELDYDMVAINLNELAALTGGVEITLTDARPRFPPRQDRFYYENGLPDFVAFSSRVYQPIHAPVYAAGGFDAVVREETRRMEAEICFQYTQQTVFNQMNFLNLRRTKRPGVHLEGFINGLVYSLNLLAGAVFKPAHVKGGLISVVCVQHPNLVIDRNREWGVGNPDVEAAVFDLTVDAIARFAEQHPDDMQKIIDRCLANKKARDS